MHKDPNAFVAARRGAGGAPPGRARARMRIYPHVCTVTQAVLARVACVQTLAAPHHHLSAVQAPRARPLLHPARSAAVCCLRGHLRP